MLLLAKRLRIQIQRSSARTGNGTTFFCYFWQYPGNAHISTIKGSRGLVRKLSRWHPGSPWFGRGSVPGGRFHDRLMPFVAKLSALPNAKIAANDAVWEPAPGINKNSQRT